MNRGERHHRTVPRLPGRGPGGEGQMTGGLALDLILYATLVAAFAWAGRPYPNRSE